MKILVLNSGSSSQKACLYEVPDVLPDHPPACLWEGKVEFGDDNASITVKSALGSAQRKKIQLVSREQVVRHLLNNLADGSRGVLTSLSEIDAVGHRVVHGGPHFEEPLEITPEVRAAIAEVTELAPLHTPAAIEGMEIVQGIFGTIPQIAVFDTGFHRQMPPEAATY